MAATACGYETVIGLEVHVELKTKTKMFCSCPTDFGAPPNTQCCPVCMGHPGALPTINGRAIEYAVRAGLALNCEIAEISRQDRKNYFYPDMPKAYQISQYDIPLCSLGYLDIMTQNGQKRVGITRIHIEEDAGKLIHDESMGTLLDLNRCGVPLIEIVSEPDMRSADEAVAYLKKLRAVLLYTGISDCRMNEGSLRCDVNLSVRRLGERELGTRTEMKNLNSFSFIAKAIEYETQRQIEIIESGGRVLQQTLRFDSGTGRTYPMRDKENANDYRFFPEPDLPPICVSREEIEKIGAAIPELPDKRRARYVKEYGISEYDAEQITSQRELADYFESGAEKTEYPKLLANMLLSELLRLDTGDTFASRISSSHMAELATLLGDEVINSSTAKKLITQMWENDTSPTRTVKERGLEQINDAERIREVLLRVMESDTKSVNDYRNGKTAAAKAIVGQVMARTAGKANPRLLSTLIQEELNRQNGK